MARHNIVFGRDQAVHPATRTRQLIRRRLRPVVAVRRHAVAECDQVEAITAEVKALVVRMTAKNESVLTPVIS